MKPCLQRTLCCLLIIGSIACNDQPSAPNYSCPSCTITTEPVVALRGGPLESEPGPAAVIVRTSRGEYLVADLPVRHLIAVYDSAGRFIRTVGRRGGGPGEFEEITDVAVGRGDSVFVMHDGRLSVLDAELNFVRGQTLDASQPSLIATLDDGSFVTASAMNATPPRVHRYSERGPEPLNVGPTGDDDNIKGLSAQGDTLWVFRSYDAQLDQIVIGQADSKSINYRGRIWLRDEALAKNDRMQRPPTFNDIMPAVADDMWIASLSYQNDRSLQAQRGGNDDAPRRLGTGEWNNYARSILELINTKTARPIAGGPTPLGIGGFIDRDHLFAIAEDSAGRSVATIYRITLKH